MHTLWKFIGIPGLACCLVATSLAAEPPVMKDPPSTHKSDASTRGYFGANKGVPGAYQSPLVRGNPLFPWEGLDRRA